MPETTVLNYAAALERLNKAIEVKGADYVNAPLNKNGFRPHCRNVNEDGSGSCIVGTAFLPEITTAGLTFEDEGNNVGVGSLLQSHLDGQIQVTLKALRLLERVQDRQDSGDTWGDALTAAQEYANDTYLGYELDDKMAVPDPTYA